MNLKPLAVSAVLSVSFGCGVEPNGVEPSDVAVEPPATQQEALVGVSSLYWPPSWHYEAPNWVQGPTFVEVCFLAGTPAQREQVRNRVERTWQRTARVTFRGWQTCNGSNNGIRIDFRQTPGLGSSSVFGTMALNPGTTMVLDPFDTQGSTARPEFVITHEFGHALSFAHAECRTDYTTAGDKNLNGVPDGNEASCATAPDCVGTRMYGAYDVRSVMSACGRSSVSLPTFSIGLSPNDVAGVQTAYGRKIAGHLVTPRGKCLTMPNASQGLVADCDEYYDRQELRLKLANESLDIGGACLESAPVGSPSVFMYPVCDGYSGQKWRFESVSIIGWGGLCVDLANGNTNGGRVQLWECGALGGVNQRWSPTPTGEIKFGASTSSSCLTAVGGAYWVQPCTGSSTQQFDLLAGGQLRRRASGLCVDAQGPQASVYAPTSGNGAGLPGNGIGLNEFSCLSSQLNQKFHLSGPVRHVASASCLERVANGVENGTLVQRAPCTGAEAQLWDYYPL
ncbi:MAG: ricin-type beta-trefoil lectin domain protein [Myxococcus sp.]|nr:ricin-type beta-trefoil lectin domain protein [Myxococcus sp.]